MEIFNYQILDQIFNRCPELLPGFERWYYSAVFTSKNGRFHPDQFFLGLKGNEITLLSSPEYDNDGWVEWRKEVYEFEAVELVEFLQFLQEKGMVFYKSELEKAQFVSDFHARPSAMINPTWIK